MLKAVIFDIDDTLYDQKIPFNMALQAYLGATAAHFDVAKAFQQFSAATDRLSAKVSLGDWQLTQLQAYRSQTMLSSQGLANLQTDHSIHFELLYQKALQQIQLFPNFDHLLNKLSHHFQLGIVTNGPAEQQLAKIRQLHLDRFIKRQNTFISEEIGVAKPDPAIFTKLAHQMNLHANELAFVGDNYFNDISAAKNAGWQAFWYNHRNREQPSQGPVPDQTVTSAEELIELLTALSDEHVYELD